MRAVALIHFYPPYRMAGSETMLHTMLQALKAAGHDVHAVSTSMPESPEEWEFGGIRAYRASAPGAGPAKVRELNPDVIISHHDHAPLAIFTARELGVPSVFVMHNSFDMNRPILAMQPDLTVFNTEWIAREFQPALTADWMVVHPPIWAHEHATQPGACVTLVNLNQHKGVHVFAQMARLFPDVTFLGVTGAHGEQVTVGMPSNVIVAPQTSNMRRDVWSKTRVLLMPSFYESYGMCGVEAMASGIPVVAHPTPGLKEALGYAGVFCDRERMDQYSQALHTLLRNPAAWATASHRALTRSKELDPRSELDAWVKRVEKLTARRRV